MYKKLITILLVLLVAVQSVAAVADAHRYHQTGEKHLEFNHDHDAMDQVKPLPDMTDQGISKSSKTPFDCHHCCHCHGLVSFSVPSAEMELNTPYSSVGATEYQFVLYFTHYPPHLRPPIV